MKLILILKITVIRLVGHKTMIENLSKDRMISLRKYFSWLTYVPCASLPFAYWLNMQLTQEVIFPYIAFVFLFLIIPIIDQTVGGNATNPDEETDVPQLSEKVYYRVITVLCFPLQIITLSWSIYILNTVVFSTPQLAMWVFVTGSVGAFMSLSVGHELIHRASTWEKTLGQMILTTIGFGSYKVEHIRNHHVHVATSMDPVSAYYNQSVYSFLLQAYYSRFLIAWKLECERMRKIGAPIIHWRNEVLLWNSIILIGVVILYATLGLSTVLFFIAQCFVAFTAVEIINYVEHYGLRRRKLANGKYERVAPEHSWNSNHFLTCMLQFQIQRHADHHLRAGRRYQVLRHFDESPQLPFGYGIMSTIALIPPVWKAIMNPRVEEFYNYDESRYVTDKSRDVYWIDEEKGNNKIALS